MKGVKFGGLHSYDEWGLILTEKELKSPDIKTYTVELEGSNGVLDFTDFFGAVKYENRQLTFSFIKPNITPDGFLSLYSLVQNALHGKKMQVILDDDPAYFYYGRVSINDWKSNKGIGEIVIEVDAEPYKYKVSRTGHFASLGGKNLINLNAGNIGTNGTWTKTTNGFSYVRGSTVSGSYVSFKIPLAAGNTYTLSAGVTSAGTAAAMYVYSDRLYGTVIANGNKEVTFKPEKSGFYYIALITSSTTTSAGFTNVMLEKGTVATAYEAFDNTPKLVSAFLDNLKMPAVPTIYASDYVELYNGEEPIVLYAGESITAEEYELKEGSNQFNVEGTGVVVFDWQEGGL